MSTLENLQELSGSALMATELMSLLGLNQFDLEDPIRYERFKDVIKGLKGEENYSYIVKKTTMNKNVDKLDHVWSYLELQKQREDILNEYKKVDEGVSTLLNFSSEKGANPIELKEYKDLATKRGEITGKLRKLESEIELYE